ncbi:TPA: hypothetical protein ACX6RX_003162 [Photobacterium damselae]
MTSAKSISKKEKLKAKRESSRLRQSSHREAQLKKGLSYIYLSVTSEAFDRLRKIKVAGGFRNLHEAAAACIMEQFELSPEFQPRNEKHIAGFNNYPFWLPVEPYQALIGQTEYQSTSIAMSAYIEANAIRYGV